MTKENTGGPAPTFFTDAHAASMTLRDYFASKALIGILHDSDVFWDGAAPLAYRYADAMLKARKS